MNAIRLMFDFSMFGLGASALIVAFAIIKMKTRRRDWDRHFFFVSVEAICFSGTIALVLGLMLLFARFF